MNDTPFVPLPSPPRSPSQTETSRNIRGNDFGPTEDDDETVRAIAYAAHVTAMAKNVRDRMLALKGSNAAYKSLMHKTMPLTNGAPPYVESEL